MASTRFPHSFADPGLRLQALTHRSAGRPNNERLEFLGDALLNASVAEMLFEAFPKADEGDLTRMRASLVNGTALAGVARELALGDQIRLGPGELKSGGFRRDSILADALEAMLAAVYLDGGFGACRATIRQLFATRLEGLSVKEKDAKTSLQELLQRHALPLPQYELIATFGEDHAKLFDIECVLATPALRVPGRGNSRRAAEQLAAETALQQLKEHLSHGR
ncbi:MAG: ribonuclease III [Tahibacter sp.]